MEKHRRLLQVRLEGAENIKKKSENTKQLPEKPYSTLVMGPRVTKTQ
jgi:hypothetical protein